MINGIQFQKGVSLPDFMARYGSEPQSEAAFIHARWPQGFRCPHCQHQTSVRAGTIMEHSKLPLRK